MVAIFFSPLCVRKESRPRPLAQRIADAKVASEFVVAFPLLVKEGLGVVEFPMK